MLTLKVLSLLLSYPEADMLAALNDMIVVINQENRLSETHKKALLARIHSYRGADVLDLQEQYVALFDRGRFLSLHIFEHVHGESRDRGQAMVNLLQRYEAHGFELSVQELPDYIPLFLEFLSHQEADEAISLLRDAMPVLSLLGARLAERGSAFRVIFEALENLAGEPEGIGEIRQQAAMESPDDTLLHMDDIWAEEAVSFMGAGEACQTSAEIAPVTIMPSSQYRQSQNRSPEGVSS